MTRITSRWDDSLTLYECGVESREKAIEEAVAKGVNLSGQSILQLGGSRHWIVALRNPNSVVEVSIGCRRYSLEQWLESYEVVGKREGYTETEIAEYGAHLRYIEQWAQGVKE